MGRSTGGLPPDVRDAMVSRLDEAPVRLALLFGSHATGETTAASDVDIAVAYEPDVTNVTDAHLSLVADLTRILGRDDVDVVRLAAVDPQIAIEALDHGHLLVGTQEDVTQFRDQLDEQRQERNRRIRGRISEAERAIERRIKQREHG